MHIWPIQVIKPEIFEVPERHHKMVGTMGVNNKVPSISLPIETHFPVNKDTIRNNIKVITKYKPFPYFKSEHLLKDFMFEGCRKIFNFFGVDTLHFNFFQYFFTHTHSDKFGHGVPEFCCFQCV